MERTLVQRSMEDDSFRQRLLDDPKGAVEQELATQLPEGVEVSVVEESEELSDRELEEVAGGGTTVDWSGCDSCVCSHHC
jgi:hypothetical protein